MSNELPHPVQLSQLRLRSITAGLDDLSELVTGITIDSADAPCLAIRRDYESAPSRAVEVPVAHVIALARLESNHPARAPVAPSPLHTPPNARGVTFNPATDEVRLSDQQHAVKRIMSGGSWWTIEELCDALHAGGVSVSPAGASARIRDLRKPQHGGHKVEREKVKGSAGLFRYRLVVNA